MLFRASTTTEKLKQVSGRVNTRCRGFSKHVYIRLDIAKGNIITVIRYMVGCGG